MRGHADLNEARTDGLASLGVFFVAHVGGLLVGRAFARDRELDVIDELVPLDRGVGLPYINAVIAHQGFTADGSIGIVGICGQRSIGIVSAVKACAVLLKVNRHRQKLTA